MMMLMGTSEDEAHTGSLSRHGVVGIQSPCHEQSLPVALTDSQSRCEAQGPAGLQVAK